MKEDLSITIKFENENLREANIHAKELFIELKNNIPDIKCEILREKELAQDAGSILALALSSPLLIALIGILKVYLKKRHKSSITIELGDKKVVIKNVNSQTISNLLKDYPQILEKND